MAAHSLGVAQIALALSGSVDPPLDLGRVLAMAVAHDAPEAWLGDLPKTAQRVLPPGAKDEAERRAAEELLAPFAAEALHGFRDYQKGTSRVAQFVKLCDRLQLGLRLLAYRQSGRAGLNEFEQGLRELDTSAFPNAEALRLEILAGLDALA